MKKQPFYFIGIGGIGMSSIARFLLQQGCEVGGYDKTPSRITAALIEEGATVVFDQNVKALPAAFSTLGTKVIYTPAIPEGHPQKDFFDQQGNSVVKRSVFLGELTKDKPTLAVAGTHGKTTTTAILAHLFSSLGESFTAFIGGVLNQNKTNLLSTGFDTILVEADEFDRSFLQLSPTIGCVTSVDADHLDIYGTEAEVVAAYRAFSDKITAVKVVEKKVPLSGLTYSIEEEADYFAEGIKAKGFGYQFDLHTPNKVYREVYFSQLGLHNLSNALAAFAMASQYGLSEERLVAALASFKGVERRLQLILSTSNHILIDDYAHHPTEIRAVYDTLENAYPEEEKCVVFQPHLFSRTQDFMQDFAAVLQLFDRVILLPIYPARELPIAGMTSSALAEIISPETQVEVVDKTQLREKIDSLPQRIKVILGAGDIGLELNVLKEKLQQHGSI
ncbi:MAG: UDP-N-acetylmuramate--L-alanine ligase [Flavobacteriaceae bacterium]|nr:UDP-N-acetylmuramate--L-alanine ligase [Flavobacteriaceae bacterium]